VYNSGHLVPFNRPVAALDLIERLLTEKSYVDQKIEPIIVDVTLPPDEKDDTMANTSAQTHRVELLLAVVVAFVTGYLVSRFQHNGKLAGYESVPSAS
jgi:hypothetical protein